MWHWTEPGRGKRALAGTVLFWLAVAAVVTLLLHALRGELDKAHMVLAYLLVVLFASARSGRIAGLLLSIACFLAFNFFLLPPYYTLAIEDPLDWLVLGAFLVTGAVAAELLHRSQREAEAARRRSAELSRLATLGAETLGVARAEDAVAAIARVMRDELGVESCRIYVRGQEPDDVRLLAGGAASGAGGGATAPTAAADVAPGWSVSSTGPPGPPARGEPELLRLVMDKGVVAFERLDGTTHMRPAAESVDASLLAAADARVVLFPLRVRDRVVGVLRLEDDGGVRLSSEQARLAAPLAYYAALGVERTRLTAEAEHAVALREADRLKDTLIATVSHDLRTPLTTIKALASEMRTAGDERAATIEEEADRLNRLVADLLDLSRARSGALPLHIELNAADDLAGAALQQLRPGEADLVDVHLQEGEMLIGRFDFVHALRALANLVENALKYSPPEAHVRLDVVRQDGELLFAVEDQGPGVPPADVEHIFDAFYRSYAGGSARSPGTGLGLTIARTLAEAQGGSVRYLPAVRGGSRFELRLPAADLDAPEVSS